MSQSTRRKWIALLLLCMVQFMVVLDIAIVNVALPSIQTDLGFTQENLQWVISAYSLVFGGFLLLGGRLADLLGRRRVFMAGVLFFTGASLIGMTLPGRPVERGVAQARGEPGLVLGDPRERSSAPIAGLLGKAQPGPGRGQRHDRDRAVQEHHEKRAA